MCGHDLPIQHGQPCKTLLNFKNTTIFMTHYFVKIRGIKAKNWQSIDQKPLFIHES